VIYFVKEQNDLTAKIGVSDTLETLKKRLCSMQTGNSRKLLIVGLTGGSYRKEKELHKKYKNYRIHREWFSLSNDIREYIIKHTYDLSIFDDDFKTQILRPSLVSLAVEDEPTDDNWHKKWITQLSDKLGIEGDVKANA